MIINAQVCRIRTGPTTLTIILVRPLLASPYYTGDGTTIDIPLPSREPWPTLYIHGANLDEILPTMPLLLLPPPPSAADLAKLQAPSSYRENITPNKSYPVYMLPLMETDTISIIVIGWFS